MFGLRCGLPVLLLAIVATHVGAQQPATEFKPPDDIAFRTELIISEGTRFLLKDRTS